MLSNTAPHSYHHGDLAETLMEAALTHIAANGTERLSLRALAREAGVLLYLQNYGEGYAKGIADTFGMSVSQVQNQFRKFEGGGLLVSRLIGRARVYYWNQRNPLAEHLQAFLQLALDELPPETIEAYFRQRRRPRRSAKPT